ncbi:MAG: lipoate--protein ligase [Desulfovibrionaceae bacterium]|nr:lipoate--protein ligase [Desulfovibrionaceae bacterium]
MEWIQNTSVDPAFNLALEEVLLNEISAERPDLAVLWQNRPAVVVGRFQNTYGEINALSAERHGVDVVRRMTGGGAVYHDAGTLNYTFIHYIEKDGVIPSFKDVGKPVSEALQNLGFPVAFSGRNDLLLDGRKIAGVAQCRKGDRYLHHGCILVDTNLEALSELLFVDQAKLASKGVASVRSRVMNLADWLAERCPRRPRLTVQEVRERILLFKHGTERVLTKEEREAASRLKAKKYSTWEWIYGESPEFTFRQRRRFPWGGVEVMIKIGGGHIAAMRICGDFFCNEDAPLALDRALEGCCYSRKTAEAALNALPLSSFFPQSSAEDWLLALFPD